jgi:rod shape-determining protein MreB
MAAAIGGGLPIQDASGSMIVDIGGGTTEVAVISLGGIVVSQSIRVAGDEIDEMIIQYARREYDLLIGERTAEETKIAIGSAYAGVCAERAAIRGRDLITGLPKLVEISSDEVREAIAGPVAEIVEAVKLSIEQTPPELLADIMDHGILMAGGGAMLKGIDRRIAEETSMPVRVADDPLACVVQGTGLCLQNLEYYRKVFVGSQYSKVSA